MSTLKVNNLQDINGANNSTPEQVAQGRAKAWVNFNGAAATAATDMTGVADSFNVSSLIDNGTGQYRVNFTNAMSNANYSAVATSIYVSGAYQILTNTELTTSYVEVANQNLNNSAVDGKVCIAVFGD